MVMTKFLLKNLENLREFPRAKCIHSATFFLTLPYFIFFPKNIKCMGRVMDVQLFCYITRQPHRLDLTHIVFSIISQN